MIINGKVFWNNLILILMDLIMKRCVNGNNFSKERREGIDKSQGRYSSLNISNYDKST